MSLAETIEAKINHYAQSICTGGAKIDEHALGELTFYVTLRRTLSGDATPQDIGMMDAVNDTLQELGLVSSGEVFYKR